jgi:hypothetical protein
MVDGPREGKRRIYELSIAYLGRRIRDPNLGNEWVTDGAVMMV